MRWGLDKFTDMRVAWYCKCREALACVCPGASSCMEITFKVHKAFVLQINMVQSFMALDWTLTFVSSRWSPPPEGRVHTELKFHPFTSMSVEVEVLLALFHLYPHPGVLQMGRNPPGGSRQCLLTVPNTSKRKMIHVSSVLPVKCLSDSVV